MHGATPTVSSDDPWYLCSPNNETYGGKALQTRYHQILYKASTLSCNLEAAINSEALRSKSLDPSCGLQQLLVNQESMPPEIHSNLLFTRMVHPYRFGAPTAYTITLLRGQAFWALAK